MPLLLCHSPKGGVGTSFIAAQLAIALAERGHEVTALDFTFQDSLKLYFGLLPAQPLPNMVTHVGEATVVSGVELLAAHELGTDPGFRKRLNADAASPFAGDRFYIADLAAGDRETKDMLLPHALLHICVMDPRPGSLVALSKVQPGTPTIELENTAFILNQLDDTHRLSRHSHIFLRELVGDRLIGTVRRDEAVNEAAAMFEPIGRFAPASVALADLAKLAIAVERRCGLGLTPEAQS
jgi:cellulose biosynthesis protein BcsQ